MVSTCYLCGEMIHEKDRSADHIVPKGLLERSQPKVKGFDYAGTLPSHARCNNEFGPETYASKALALLEGLHNPDCFFEYPHPEIRGARMMALNAGLLPSFTERDLKFFRIIDARSKSVQQMHSPSLVENQEPIDPKRRALYVALSVLTKSAAALIVARKLRQVPVQWDVLALPYFGDMGQHGFDDLFGYTEPFDVELKTWLGRLETGDYLTIYSAKKLLVFFLFRFSADPVAWDRMLAKFGEGARLRFHAPRLIDLVGYEWKRV